MADKEPVDRVIRRRFLLGASAVAAEWLARSRPAVAGERTKDKPKPEDDISPVEDLMREHGLLRRILLVYQEGARRLENREGLPGDVLPRGANIVRRFVEDYHEKLEEEFVFPRFEKARKLVELVAVLRTQHQRGRVLTEQISKLGTASPSGALGSKSDVDRQKLVDSLRSFIRMYEPHAAREDTVLFPAFKSLIGEKAYSALGEQFEDKEQALFGKDGFEQMVAEVEKLERVVGIEDLRRFTPQV